jgi:hypothetical protein
MKGVINMQESIKYYLEQVKIGRQQSYKNMALFPLLSAYSLDLDYLLLDEALADGVIEIVEAVKEGAVPELKVINKSSRMVLILDGEELVGAKQNRIVNTTILVQANDAIIIPVSCVEMGRWSYNSPKFHSEHRIMSSGLRAMKLEQIQSSLRSIGNYRSDQGAIWDEISQKASRRIAQSPSMAMSRIYEKDWPSIQEYAGHFKLIDSQVGAVFMINGKVVGMDSFGKAESFAKVFRKLVESYALDAIDWFDPEKGYKPLKRGVTGFIRDALASQTEFRPSVGLGTDLRMESKKITGFALVLDDKIIHLSVFSRPDEGKQDISTSRMQRYSRRMRNRVY